MKQIVTISEVGWAIGRIHRDLAHELASEYRFKSHNSTNFFMHVFLKDFK